MGEPLRGANAADGADPVSPETGSATAIGSYLLVAVDGDHASVSSPEREGDFAKNRKSLVQAGQICDRYPTGFRRVLRTSICDDRVRCVSTRRAE